MSIVFKLAILSLALLTMTPDAYGYIGQLLDYCNLNSLYGEIITCLSPYVCDSNFRQCLSPYGGYCASTYQCGFFCYNSTCYANYTSLPSQGTCNATVGSTCAAPLTCNTNVCELPSGSNCTTEAYCQSGYACNNGTCSAPTLYDSCNLNGPSCQYPYKCDPFWLTCLLSLGSNCTSHTQCGGEYTRLCVNGVCVNPGINQKCNPVAANFPKTVCSAGKCDSTLGLCSKSNKMQRIGLSSLGFISIIVVSMNI